MAAEKEPLYCICQLPYDETRFMIECDVCKDWFHGGCVGVQEHQAVDIEIYHCPNCALKHGPLVLKHRRNWHRHDYSEDGTKLNTAVQTGTVIFIKELKSRSFPSAEDIPIIRLHGSQVTPEYFEKEGFSVPILCEKKDGLGLTLPSPSISIQEIERLVGSMREIDVIDVARQDDFKMLMREWTEYYNSPNRDKILNVISLEFSSTKLSEYVVPPSIIRQVSWARNVWPEQLPEDCSLVRPEVQKYCLMGVKDSFTDFHIDFGGTSVWYHVLRGEKVFYLVRPTQTNLMLYEEWLSSSNQSEMFFGDQVDVCYRMVVKQGHTLLIPTGWIHAVFTPIDTLVFGGNFLHNYNIPLQLQCYEIERNVKTPEKYLFPSYETMNWYAAKSLLDILKDYTEEGKRPPEYLVQGAKALSISLKAWTQRKDLASTQAPTLKPLISRRLKDSAHVQYAKVSKQDAADYIQYGKVLKELQKEVKKMDETKSSSRKAKNTSPKKQESKKKSVKSPKKLKGLDILDEHTKHSLHTSPPESGRRLGKLKIDEDKEQREKIYNFEDDDESNNAVSLKVRIPKAGAYIAGSDKDKKDSKDLIKKEIEGKPGKGKKKPSSNESNKVKGKPKEVKQEMEEKLVDVKPEPAAEIPQCLKFKLSNGKMVSTDKKKMNKKLKLKEFLLLGPETTKLSASDQEDIKSSKLETPEKTVSPKVKKEAKGSKSSQAAKGVKPLESSKGSKSSGSAKDSKSSESAKDSKSSEPAKGSKSSGSAKDSKSSESAKDSKSSEPAKGSKSSEPAKGSKSSESAKGSKSSEPAKGSKSSESAKGSKSSDSARGSKCSESSKGIKSLESSKAHKSSSSDKKKAKDKVKEESSKPSHTTTVVKSRDVKGPRVDDDSDSDHMVLVVDEKPKKLTAQKSTSATKPASLKRKLVPGPASKPEADNMDVYTDKIKGGLNGSISDILTASGYSGDNTSSGMRDAIAGMLTMSRMGMTPSPGVQPKGSEGKENKVQAEMDEEEQLMADCYRDSEFVYPSFELSDDEGDSLPKVRKTADKDDNWSPRARIQGVAVKMDREHRVGAQKESISTTLANTAAKLAENPPSDKKHLKKISTKLKVPEIVEVEAEPVAGPSSALDVPVNAFRPGIKRPVDPCASLVVASDAAKAKKSKKGFATAKQRLGKLLKIKKMVY